MFIPLRPLLACGVLMAALTAQQANAITAQPCVGTRPDTIEGMVCNDPELRRLDSQLAWNWRRASANLDYLQELDLRQLGERRRQGRHRCWREQDLRQCVVDDYRMRIAEIQALYRLLPADGPHHLRCSDRSQTSVSLYYFSSNPASLRLELNDKRHALLRQPHASDLVYASEDMRYREVQQEIWLRWPGSGGEQRCQPETD